MILCTTLFLQNVPRKTKENSTKSETDVYLDNKIFKAIYHAVTEPHLHSASLVLAQCSTLHSLRKKQRYFTNIRLNCSAKFPVCK